MHRVAFNLQSILLALLLLPLGACTSSDDKAASTPPINTLNIFFEALSGTSEMGIYSFNPGTERSVERGRYRDGDNLALEMDTDRDKQGYEYLAFVNTDNSDPAKDAVYLLNYDKDSGGRVTKLASFSAEVCGLFPRFKNDEQVIADQDLRSSGLVNDSVLEITQVSMIGQPCNPATDVSSLLTFDLEDLGSASSTTIAQESLSLRETLVDYSFTEDGERGRLLQLMDDEAGRLSLFDQEGKLLWNVAIPNSVSSVYAFQANVTTVGIQVDDRLYARNVSELLNAADNSSGVGSSLSLQERVFGNVFQVLGTATENDPVIWEANSNAFVVIDGADVIFYDASTLSFQNVTTLPVGATVEKLLLTNDNEILLVQNLAGSVTLAVYTWTGSFWSESLSLLSGQSGDWIDVYEENGALYVSTKNLGLTNGFSAFFFEELKNPTNVTELSNSTFIIPESFEGLTSEITLLRSDLSLGDGSLEKPSLYFFDAERPNGIALRVNSEGELIRDNMNNPEPALIGSIEANVSELLLPSTLINESFAEINLVFQTLATQKYYLDPSDRDDETLAEMDAP